MHLCGRKVLLLVFVLNTVLCALSPSEIASLDELYATTGGSGWFQSNWASQPDYCQRTGVACSAFPETVKEINLSSNNLEGTLPSLANLTGLVRLYDSLPPIVCQLLTTTFQGLELQPDLGNPSRLEPDIVAVHVRTLPLHLALSDHDPQGTCTTTRSRDPFPIGTCHRWWRCKNSSLAFGAF